MFSFRTTALLEQEDLTLRRGRLAVLDDDTAWHPQYGEYLYYTLARYRNAVRLASLSDRKTMEGCNAVIIEHQHNGTRFDGFLKQLRDFFLEQNRSEQPLSVYIIDRFSPGGRAVEGGHYDGLPHKIGLSLGEIANMYYSEMNASFPLHIISASANDAARELMPWSIPQPGGFGSLFSAMFMSGSSLWNGTNVSCAQGTMRPLEMFGAPFMQRLERSRDFAWENALTWNDVDSPVYDKGVYMRWCSFLPESGLYAGQRCYGFQMIPNPGEPGYHSLLHTLRLIRFVADNCPEFALNERMDSLAGSEAIMDYVRGELAYDALREALKTEEQKWLRKAKKYLLYDEPLYRIK